MCAAQWSARRASIGEQRARQAGRAGLGLTHGLCSGFLRGNWYTGEPRSSVCRSSMRATCRRCSMSLGGEAHPRWVARTTSRGSTAVEVETAPSSALDSRGAPSALGGVGFDRALWLVVVCGKRTCQHECVLNALAGALRHKWQHRVSRIAEQRNRPALPCRLRNRTIAAPEAPATTMAWKAIELLRRWPTGTSISTS